MKFIAGILLIMHGLIHAGYLTPKPTDPNYPFTFESGWFASMAGEPAKAVGMVFALVTIISFIIAGLAIAGAPGLSGFGNAAMVAGSLASLALLIMFWHNWLILGVVIDIVLLYGVLYLGWSFTK